MTNNQVTYGQLDKVLRELGFICQKVGPRWKRYEHAASDTVILLGDRQPNEAALQSEVVSARVHLVQKGLVSEVDLERMMSPKPLPQKAPSRTKEKR
jgi:hypothetical protein